MPSHGASQRGQLDGRTVVPQQLAREQGAVVHGAPEQLAMERGGNLHQWGTGDGAQAGEPDPPL